MKTIQVLFVLSCLALCLVSSETVTRWGVTSGKIIGQESFVAERAVSQYQVRAFSFPNISNKKDPIVGIKHIDNADKPVEVTFVDGGIAHKDVAILIKSARGHGLNSTFIFYGM